MFTNLCATLSLSPSHPGGQKQDFESSMPSLVHVLLCGSIQISFLYRTCATSFSHARYGPICRYQCQYCFLVLADGCFPKAVPSYDCLVPIVANVRVRHVMVFVLLGQRTAIGQPSQQSECTRGRRGLCFKPNISKTKD